MKLSDYIASRLEEYVKHVFCVSGGGCIHVCPTGWPAGSMQSLIQSQPCRRDATLMPKFEVRRPFCNIARTCVSMPPCGSAGTASAATR